MMRILIFVLFFVTSACCYGGSQIANYHVSGDVSAVIQEGIIRVMRDTAAVGKRHEIAADAIVKGQVELSIQVDEIQNVYIVIEDANEDFKASAGAVLENGEITLSIQEPGNKLHIKSSGHYQPLLFAWTETEEHKRLKAEYLEIMEQLNAMPEGDERKSFTDEVAWPKFHELQAVRSAALRDLALSDSDPVLARLALLMNGLGRDEAPARLEELDKVLGPSDRANDYKARLESSRIRRENAATFGIGKSATEFTLPTLDGEMVSFHEVLSKNQYVLLEFWASWCAPCRVEIPHMKAVYAEYAARGFEILSVSLDSDRLDWEELSEEENVPWINTSDLQAYNSPVALQYGVAILPKNYLISSEGVIIEKDLRKEHLDAAIKKYFDGAAVASPMTDN